MRLIFKWRRSSWSPILSKILQIICDWNRPQQSDLDRILNASASRTMSTLISPRGPLTQLLGIQVSHPCLECAYHWWPCSTHGRGDVISFLQCFLGQMISRPSLTNGEAHWASGFHSQGSAPAPLGIAPTLCASRLHVQHASSLTASHPFGVYCPGATASGLTPTLRFTIPP